MKFVPRRLERTADVSRGDTSWQSFVKNALSVLIVFALGYLALGALADVMARTIPDRWEAKAFGGEIELPSIDIDADATARAERVEGVLRRLTATTGLRDLPFRVFVMPGADPNAFAFPGGAIGVTSGLLDSVGSELGLAMVIGHELGHHQGRHPLKRAGRSMVFSVAGALLFGSRGGSSVVEGGLAIAESGYSRRQEREADAFGLRLVFELYGQTEGSLEFFEMLDEAGNGERGQRWATFLRSHPLTVERIEALRLLGEELENAR